MKDKKLKAQVQTLADLHQKVETSPEWQAANQEYNQTMDRMQDAFMRLSDLARELHGPRPPKEARKKVLTAEMQDLEKAVSSDGELTERLHEAQRRRADAGDRVIQAGLTQALKVSRPVAIKVDSFEPGHTDAEKTAVHSAAAWLAGKVQSGPDGAALPPYKVIKDDTPTSGRAGPSAYYQDMDHSINVHGGMCNVATNVHEMGHGIEYKVPGVQSAAQRFLAHRVGDEPLQKLAVVLPDHGYGPDETGRKDQFGRAFSKGSAYYCGKEYAFGATEIVSMGVEKLYEDGVRFAQQDPEYAAFILGVLNGRIRDNPVPMR